MERDYALSNTVLTEKANWKTITLKTSHLDSKTKVNLVNSEFRDYV